MGYFTVIQMKNIFVAVVLFLYCFLRKLIPMFFRSSYKCGNQMGYLHKCGKYHLMEKSVSIQIKNIFFVIVSMVSPWSFQAYMDILARWSYAIRGSRFGPNNSVESTAKNQQLQVVYLQM